jgi:hypothetical protein
MFLRLARVDGDRNAAGRNEEEGYTESVCLGVAVWDGDDGGSGDWNRDRGDDGRSHGEGIVEPFYTSTSYGKSACPTKYELRT